MNFELSPEHRLLVESVAGFMRREVLPHLEEMDELDRFPEGLWRKIGAQGLLG